MPKKSIHPQLNTHGELRHLLSIGGLSKDIITHILTTAASFLNVNERGVEKLPLMQHKNVFNLFFEPSTRTRTSFEIAAQCLSANVLNFNMAVSSVSKGESLLDTIDNLAAMHAKLFVVRHALAGAPFLIAQHINDTQKTPVHVINAGDGRHEHPTQGLLDMYTIWHYKKDFTQLCVAIVGDIMHSRVAHSDICALRTLGVSEIRVIAPYTLLPEELDHDIRVFTDIKAGLRDVDVIIMLRLQNERMHHALLPSAREFFNSYGLTLERLALAKSDAIVMHPGPMNRGVEIDSVVADGAQSVILSQVRFGIAIRMAVMSIINATTH